MRKAYLTIDDGPSEKFTALVDFLHDAKIPAVFFNRGDNMDARPDAVIYGIKKGFVMANHTYTHPHAVDLPYEEICNEIRRTDNVLERLYAEAGVARPGKYFRFPYMDRGMGPAFCEPGTLKAEYEAPQLELLGAGLGHKPQVPGIGLIDKKRKIQTFLKSLGYTNLPVEGVTLPWYANTEMASAVDSLCTFSTSDWALLERHKGKHGFSTVKELTDQIDRSTALKDMKSRHIILAHDQAEIHDVTVDVVKYMQRDFEFLDFKA
jgi:peptidoglycan/xylan/chitin deacetylase (PgdA/CDA1 family)